MMTRLSMNISFCFVLFSLLSSISSFNKLMKSEFNLDAWFESLIDSLTKRNRLWLPLFRLVQLNLKVMVPLRRTRPVVPVWMAVQRGRNGKAKSISVRATFLSSKPIPASAWWLVLNEAFDACLLLFLPFMQWERKIQWVLHLDLSRVDFQQKHGSLLVNWLLVSESWNCKVKVIAALCPTSTSHLTHLKHPAQIIVSLPTAESAFPKLCHHSPLCKLHRLLYLTSICWYTIS